MICQNRRRVRILRWIAPIMALLFLFVSGTGTAFAKEECYHWYCMRNREHLQPKAAKELAFIEKYDGYYVDHAHGDHTKERVVYLTFDAGYENGNIERILNTLQEKEVPGAFFILGNLVKRNQSLVRRMIDEGHLVCNHTMHHHDMAKCETKDIFSQELQSLEKLYRDTFGCEIEKFYRPPEGSFTRETMRYAKELGYQTVFWSLAYADWNNEDQPDPTFAKEKILSNLHNGAVILLHPTSKTNADILPELIDLIRSEGYSFGTLYDLTGQKR